MTLSYTAALKVPLLGAEQERQLIHCWQNSQDKSALQALIDAHVRLVHAYVRRFVSPKEDRYEDMVAEGTLGVIQAADRFDLERDVRFSTYAQWWIANKVRTANAATKELADGPAGNRDALLTDPQVIVTNPTALDGEEVDLQDQLQCTDPNPEERAIADSNQDALRRDLAKALTNLEAMEQDVVLSRSFRSSPDSFETLSQRHGVARDRLRQIERRAMSRLRHALLTRGVTAERAFG